MEYIYSESFRIHQYMKKGAISVIVFLLAFAAGMRAQDSLTISAGGNIYNLPSTAYFNDLLPCTVYVKNIGSNVFQDTIFLTTAVDSTPFDTTSDFIQNITIFLGISLNPNDSVAITLNEIIYPLRYRVGGNIVVIWPAASSAIFNNIAGAHYIDILGYASVPYYEDGDVRVYPIPFGSVINIYSDHPNRIPETISISDLSGKVLLTTDVRKGEAKIDELPDGFYLAKIVFSDGSYSVVRVVRAGH